MLSKNLRSQKQVTKWSPASLTPAFIIKSITLQAMQDAASKASTCTMKKRLE
jgi:hypothetical protein